MKKSKSRGKVRSTPLAQAQASNEASASSPPTVAHTAVEGRTEQVSKAPHAAGPVLSPLTIALQKERGIYNKRKMHCPPQNQRWSKEYAKANS